MENGIFKKQMIYTNENLTVAEFYSKFGTKNNAESRRIFETLNNKSAETAIKYKKGKK